MASMGGLVTWAKSCLKYWNKSGCALDNTASGVSVPMEAVGSPPERAMGMMTSRMSSQV
jgi:hypothetical protein